MESRMEKERERGGRGEKGEREGGEGRGEGRGEGGREGGRRGGGEGAREGGREGGREEGREGGRKEGGRKEGREGEREGGREEGREGGREEGREGGRKGRGEGREREKTSCVLTFRKTSSYEFIEKSAEALNEAGERRGRSLLHVLHPPDCNEIQQSDWLPSDVYVTAYYNYLERLINYLCGDVINK